MHGDERTHEVEQNNEEIAAIREGIAIAKRQKWNGYKRDVARMQNRIAELEARNDALTAVSA
jgi:hypothetical protein